MARRKLRSSTQERSEGPLLAGISAGALEGVERFLKMVKEEVSYKQVWDGDPPLDVPTFLQLQTLTILDVFFRLPDDEVNRVLGYDGPTLARLRSHPKYDDLMMRVQEAGRRLTDPQSLQEVVENSESTIAHELLLAALEPATERGRMAKNIALGAVVDRLAAKKGRSTGQKLTVYLPPNLEANIEFGLRITQPTLQGTVSQSAPLQLTGVPTTEDDFIDAEVLNVPGAEPRLGGPPGEE